MSSPTKVVPILTCMLLCLLSACGLALDEEARFERAREAFTAGDFAAAQVDLKALLQENPDHIDARLLLGEALVRGRDVASGAQELVRAMELLRQAEQGSPPRPNAGREIVETAAKLGTLQIALKEFAPALENGRLIIARDPSNVVGYGIASQAAYNTGDYATARSYATQLLEQSPDNPLGHSMLGFVAVREGANEEAEQHLNASLAQQPDNQAVRLALTQLQILSRKHGEAVATLAPLLVTAPTDANLLQLLNRMELGRPEVRARVEEVAQGIEAANAASPVPDILRGRALNLAREHQAASDRFQSAMSKGGGRYAVIGYHVAQRGLGNQAAAQQALEQWIESNPADQGVGFMLAAAYTEQGQNDRARELYEKLVGTAEVDSPVILNNLALLYGEVNDPRAIETARQAHQLAPNNGAITDTLGWLLVQAGEYEEGITLLRLAQQQAPQVEEIGYHLAAALAQFEEQDPAQRQIDRAFRAPGGVVTPERSGEAPR